MCATLRKPVFNRFLKDNARQQIRQHTKRYIVDDSCKMWTILIHIRRSRFILTWDLPIGNNLTTLFAELFFLYWHEAFFYSMCLDNIMLASSFNFTFEYRWCRVTRSASYILFNMTPKDKLNYQIWYDILNMLYILWLYKEASANVVKMYVPWQYYTNE